jgi:hypothetical protein
LYTLLRTYLYSFTVIMYTLLLSYTLFIATQTLLWSFTFYSDNAHFTVSILTKTIFMKSLPWSFTLSPSYTLIRFTDWTSNDRTSYDWTSNDPTSNDPTSNDPTSTDPTSTDPTSNDPTLNDSTSKRTQLRKGPNFEIELRIWTSKNHT